MTDQRFKYYTGYEVDNEPSDDEEDYPCNTAITNTNDDNSDSSSDEFDEPLRNYIKKTMASTEKMKNSATTSATTDAFANEMEDELDQIYHNFISRGTFELPISTQKSPEKKKVILKEQDEADSDDDDDDKNEEENKPVLNKEEQKKVDDDLLYDPDEENEDEKWMTNERLKSQGINAQKPDNAALGPTDAVLNCPGCMVLVCHDCQRHELYRNQYRAMFVFNCTIDENRLASLPKSNSQKKKNNKNKRFKTNETNQTTDQMGAEQETDEEILRPVLCNECGTELGVYESKEELYHFVNVLASH